LFSVNWFSSANILTVADSISSTSNIWTLDKAETETSTLQNALYVCATPTVGTGHTFSVSTTAPGYPSFEVAAFTWGSTLTAFSSNGATSSTPATSADFGSVTNGGAPFDAYLFSTFAFNDGGSGMSGFSIGGGATITDTVPMAPGVNFGGGIAFQKVTGFTGSWGPTWSWSNNSAALAGISIGFS
jgi:hypothetical protein